MSEFLLQLFADNTIWLGIWDTFYMTVLSTTFAYLFGLPLGVILYNTQEKGLFPLPWLNRILSLIVNIFRSIPFIILMVAFLPVAKVLVGSSLGNGAMIVMLVIAATPFIARLTESSLNELDEGVIEAAKSMGASNTQIIFHVMLPECKPSLIGGAIIAAVTVLGYSAMSSTIGGTGLGQIAIVYGYQRYHDDVIWICVALMVILVQILQEVGAWIMRKTDKRNK